MNKYGMIMPVALLSMVIAACAPPPQPVAVVVPEAPQPVAVVVPEKPKTFVVVVPAKDGKVGAVVVTTTQGETLINRAYAAASVLKDGRTETSSLTEQDVQAMFHATLQVRPEPPLSFILYFLEGKDELTAESKQRLSDILAEIARRGSNVSEVTVVGHTDRVGKLEYNDRLSLQRAQKVAAGLVKIGVQTAALSVAGRGEREPLVPTNDEVAEPRNRRVEISIR